MIAVKNFHAGQQGRLKMFRQYLFEIIEAESGRKILSGI
jgi:hypothetical protein